MPSCDDWLSVLRRHLREPLFQPESTDRLCRLARRLPGNLLAALEVRLGAQAPIDLSLRAREHAEALLLAGYAFPPHVQSFLSRWAGSDPSLAPVHSVWLEFDLDREPAGLPEPLVCTKLYPGSDPGWLNGTLFPALQGEPLTGSQQRLVRACHEAIPAPGYLLYAFSLRSRQPGTVRLEVFGLDPAAIQVYLKRVVPEALPWIEADLFEGVERIHLSLDLDEEVRPRIGIEGSFSRLPGREPRWGELFERLASRGLCRPEKRDAALAWQGSETFWTAPSAWPVEAAGTGGFCFRKLSHVKAVFRPDREPEGKAYLLFGYLPATR